MGKPYQGTYYPGATQQRDVLVATDGQSWVVDGLGGDDDIYGGDQPDVLVGGRGNDTIFGSPHDSVIDGGTGNDTADFSGYVSGTDFGVVARIGAGLMHVAVPDGSPMPPTNSLINIENLVGSSADDVLDGDRRANVIEGGAGDDLISGFGGGDTLSGDSGSDVFVFNSNSRGMTTIADFDPTGDGEGDRISLSGLANIVVTTDEVNDRTIITYGEIGRFGGEIILENFSQTWDNTWFLNGV